MFLTIVFEPLQLSVFGTTLGKWILGIYVFHNDDRKLTLYEAIERTGMVLYRGLGLHIPVYNYIRLWKSYKACTEQETPEWETDSRLVLKDERSIRTVVYLATVALLAGVVLCVNVLAQIPIHRGSLSVSQFCQNYRQMEKFYKAGSDHILDNDGVWREEESVAGYVTVYVFKLGNIK